MLRIAEKYGFFFVDKIINQDCLWGDGAYFAENAKYSYDYSYLIKNSDDPQYVNKRVFLCCIVSLGKCIKLNQDSTLQKPPPIENMDDEDYDCVTGFTNGSNVEIKFLFLGFYSLFI